VDARTGPLEFWDAILRRIYAATDVETLARTVVAEAPKLIGSVHASFNAMAPSVPWAQIWMDRGDDPERLQRSFAAHMHEHPAVRNFLRTGDPTTHAISDFASARVFQATQLYQQLYRELGVRDQMGFCLGPPGRENFALALGREGRSFTATDRRWMERLRPHVGQALDNARAFERLNRRLQGAVEGASALGHALVVLDQALRPVVYPTAAERLLQRFLPRPWGSEAALPGDLLRWLRVSLAASAPARWRVPEGSGASRSPWILTRGGERLVVRAKPSLRPRPEAVGEFQQAAAGEELTRVGHIDVDGDVRFRASHVVGSCAVSGASLRLGWALAAQSAARSRDSRYAKPHRPY